MSNLVITQHPADRANFSVGRFGNPIDTIVVHSEQGTERGTELWFADPQAHASAHYSIGRDGAISQSVQDADTAYHCGNAVFNRRSIGIELEGYEEQGDFPDPMVDALARLCIQLDSQYQIGLDRAHIIGHREVPDPIHPGLFGGANHHTDPGTQFPWSALMSRLGVPVAGPPEVA